MEELERLAGRELLAAGVILAHLGNGCAWPPCGTAAVLIRAWVSRRPPVSDEHQIRRSRPGLVSYLARTEGLTVDQFHHLVNAESGLLGISG